MPNTKTFNSNSFYWYKNKFNVYYRFVKRLILEMSPLEDNQTLCMKDLEQTLQSQLKRLLRYFWKTIRCSFTMATMTLFAITQELLTWSFQWKTGLFEMLFQRLQLTYTHLMGKLLVILLLLVICACWLSGMQITWPQEMLLKLLSRCLKNSLNKDSKSSNHFGYISPWLAIKH